jgi:hypothetical protein
VSQEDNARAAVPALIPDVEILDVALTCPRGDTKSQAVAWRPCYPSGVMPVGSRSAQSFAVPPMSP